MAKYHAIQSDVTTVQLTCTVAYNGEEMRDEPVFSEPPLKSRGKSSNQTCRRAASAAQLDFLCTVDVLGMVVASITSEDVHLKSYDIDICR